ncbi:Hypothetical protein KVN_LOCUS507 [uncultured virus]|nr:Hypothetical protein KVN_LOCUS507 [uncultured virus]
MQFDFKNEIEELVGKTNAFIEHIEHKKFVENFLKFCSRKEYCTIFGGYLRDNICALNFKEIDIKFENEEFTKKFINSLRDIYSCYFKRTRSLKNCNSFGCIQIRIAPKPLLDKSIILNIFEIFIDIDLVFPISTRISCIEKQIGLDFDVNQLIMRENQISVNPNCGLTYSSIFKNINSKEFLVLDSFGKTFEHKNLHQCVSIKSNRGRKIFLRINKMEKKGWTCINKQTCFINHECILANRKTITDFIYKQDKKRIQDEIQNYWKIVSSGQFNYDSCVIFKKKLSATDDFEKKLNSKKINEKKRKYLFSSRKKFYGNYGLKEKKRNFEGFFI